MSLVEMLVAMFILAVSLTALASSIITSLTAMSRDERRVRATQLANEELETLQGMPWDATGFYADDAGYTATAGGAQTVTLGLNRAGATHAASAPTPTETFVRDGITYSVTRQITWVDDPADGVAPSDIDPNDLKTFSVDIAWDDRGRPGTFTNTAQRAPSVEEVPLTTATAPPVVGFSIVSYDVSPVEVGISPSGRTMQAINIELTTSEPATTVTLTLGQSSGPVDVPMTPVGGSPATEWIYQVPIGDNSYVVGESDFTVRANDSSGGVASQTKKVRFIQQYPATVTILTPSPAPPSALCVGTSGSAKNDLWANKTLQFTVQGLVSGTARLDWTATSGFANATVVGTSGDDVTFRVTVPAGTRFNQSNSSFTFRAVRTADGVTATETYVYDVVGASTAGACP